MSTQVWCGVQGLLIHQMCFGSLWMWGSALGWGLLFSSVRHEARTLIRTHLLVRETLRSDYSSNLIRFLPHFSCSKENRLSRLSDKRMQQQGDGTERLFQIWRTLQNFTDLNLERARAQQNLTSLSSSSPSLLEDELNRSWQGGFWFVT